MTLKDIARPLAEKGCRVMLFDLFGRGYSDAPGDLPYDTRLFTTQILLALASSPLAWTGRAGFSLVGYSLGGGIAANFAAAFPDLVAQLVLLAPAGLIRPENIGRASRIVFQTGLVPDRVLAWLAERRLRAPIDNAVSKRRRLSSTSTPPAPLREKGARAEQQQEDYVDVAVQDAVDPQPPTTTHQQQQEEEEEGGAASGPTPYELRVASFVHWSLDHNAGFVPAMMSTMQHAPLMGQHNHWRLLARRPRGSTAVLLGRHDNLIQRADYEEDALPLLGGRDNVFWRVVPGAHNFPFTHGEQAMKVICEFMGL
ncbi:Alpha/Beta hydrolase protein [Xylariaceae sp. FL0804]|nr:Alpha/Beta hydrolase protein [Xylariaceae sp. FL0804]